MEANYNNGTYFFNIVAPELKALTFMQKNVTKIINDDVIAFSITEELGKYITGTLTMKDDSHVYSALFLNGMNFQISWGYRTFAELGFLNQTKRNGLQCFLQSPSGEASDNGEVTYTVAFFGQEMRTLQDKKVFNSGTKMSMIGSLMDDLQVVDKYINFDQGKDLLSDSTVETQWGSSWGFLFELAKKYRCLFRIAYKNDGTRAGMFIDDTKLGNTDVRTFLMSLTGTDQYSKELYFNAGQKSNVSSYNWQHHIGENGAGDDIQMVLVNGRPVYNHRVIESGRVVTYKLDTVKLEKALGDANKSLDDRTTIWNSIISATDFEQVKKWFVPVVSDTAPQGMGFTINCKMLGDPMLIIPMEIIFKKGFPAPLTQSQDPSGITKFFLRKVTHTISKQGYFCDLEICDLYTINGSFIADTKNIQMQGPVGP